MRRFAFSLVLHSFLLAATAAHAETRAGEKAEPQVQQEQTKEAPLNSVVLPSLAERVARTVRDQPAVDPDRFGDHPANTAFGAYQRGLYITAHNLAKPMAEKGDAAAQMLMAEILSRGLGMPRDGKAAAEWYVKAAAQGIPEAKFQHALMLMDGKLVTADREKAFTLMGEAAALGNRLARFNYAQMIIARKPGDAGLAEALPWFEQAARQGLPDAQYALSQFLSEGAGGKARDDALARKWLELAARGGYDSAMVDLGIWLVEGRGGERKAEEGFFWMRNAALAGNVAAQSLVAKLYRTGIGVEGSSIDAAAWYVLARRAGLHDHELDVFLDGLTPEQMKTAIEKANRLR